MKKGTLIALAVVVFLVFGFLAPVVPVGLPPGVWTEEDFATVKPEIEAAAEKLNDLTHELSAERLLPETCNLVVDYGHTTLRRPLLSSRRTGITRAHTAAFGTWMPPGLPHLDYDRKAGTARLTPENAEAFLDWVQQAESYSADSLVPDRFFLSWASDENQAAMDWPWINLVGETESARVEGRETTLELSVDEARDVIDRFLRLGPRLEKFRGEEKTARGPEIHEFKFHTVGNSDPFAWRVPRAAMENDPELRAWFAQLRQWRAELLAAGE